jgi:hypothetical protein
MSFFQSSRGRCWKTAIRRSYITLYCSSVSWASVRGEVGGRSAGPRPAWRGCGWLLLLGASSAAAAGAAVVEDSEIGVGAPASLLALDELGPLVLFGSDFSGFTAPREGTVAMALALGCLAVLCKPGPAQLQLAAAHVCPHGAGHIDLLQQLRAVPSLQPDDFEAASNMARSFRGPDLSCGVLCSGPKVSQLLFALHCCTGAAATLQRSTQLVILPAFGTEVSVPTEDDTFSMLSASSCSCNPVASTSGRQAPASISRAPRRASSLSLVQSQRCPQPYLQRTPPHLLRGPSVVVRAAQQQVETYELTEANVELVLDEVS